MNASNAAIHEASRKPGDPRQARDYARIARAIDFLRRHVTAQPDLAAVARHVSLSEHHLQRLFTRWAGVSPKRFLQYLTLEQAKARLAQQTSVLEAAGATGLSGAGRLHDLFVTMEAVSPGEFAARGAGLVIQYGVHDSPFGPCLVAATSRGICAMHFLDDGQHGDALDTLRRDWPGARFACENALTSGLARRLFDPVLIWDRPLALLVKGTNFQVQVWRALLQVPFGGLVTYRSLARRIGHPQAARAVGNAVASNAIAWLIPCHRVIRETGDFGSYRWGTARKAAMLAWEASRAERVETDGPA